MDNLENKVGSTNDKVDNLENKVDNTNDKVEELTARVGALELEKTNMQDNSEGPIRASNHYQDKA